MTFSKNSNLHCLHILQHRWVWPKKYFRTCLPKIFLWISEVNKLHLRISSPNNYSNISLLFQLDYRGVTVQNVEIAVQGGGPTNTFQTFWQQSDVDLSRGMDFTPRGPVFARFTHLQHQPFQYQVQVNNAGQQRMGTCRIFLAPKFDERGLPWLYRDQKVMFIELDRFTVSCKLRNFCVVYII